MATLIRSLAMSHGAVQQSAGVAIPSLAAICLTACLDPAFPDRAISDTWDLGTHAHLWLPGRSSCGPQMWMER